MITGFLSHLGEAATSAAALVAYFVTLLAWVFWVWQKHRVQSKAERILGQFGSDAGRIDALAQFLGNRPPPGLPKKDLMRWVAEQNRHQSRVLGRMVYLATVIALLVVIAMATFFYPSAREVRKPPVLIDSRVTRP